MSKSKSRLLPDDCYDFFVRDGRDGETRGPFGDAGRAREIWLLLRASVESYKRPCFTIEWRVNERKTLRLLMSKKKGAGRT